MNLGSRRGLRTSEAMLGAVTVALLVALLAPAGWASAQESASPDWPAVKCERYRKAWTDIVAQRGKDGLGADFLERHDAFLSSGCTARADVCPRSPQELAVANVLSAKAINAGMTGSFLPFACRN